MMKIMELKTDYSQEHHAFLERLRINLVSKGWRDGLTLLNRWLSHMECTEDFSPLSEWMSGSTIELREAIRPVCDYWETLANSNAIDSLDSCFPEL